MEISHVPLEISGEHTLPTVEVRFHLAAANPHADVLDEGCPTVAIIRGPDAYVSPRWYDYEGVPTWDYAFVHVSGIPVRLTDDDVVVHLRHLVQHAEPGIPVGEELIRRLLPGVRAFRLADPVVEPVFKLSQDKSEANMVNVIAHLRESGGPGAATAVLIEALLKSDGSDRSTVPKPLPTG